MLRLRLQYYEVQSQEAVVRGKVKAVTSLLLRFYRVEHQGQRHEGALDGVE